MSKRQEQTAVIGLSTTDWIGIFASAGVEKERLEVAKSAQGKTTIVGNFLARQVGREVRINVGGRTGTATLRSVPGRSRKKLYFFDVVFADDRSGDEQPPAARTAVARKKRSRSGGDKINVESCDGSADGSTATGLATAGNDETW